VPCAVSPLRRTADRRRPFWKTAPPSSGGNGDSPSGLRDRSLTFSGISFAARWFNYNWNQFDTFSSLYSRFCGGLKGVIMWANALGWVKSYFCVAFIMPLNLKRMPIPHTSPYSHWVLDPIYIYSYAYAVAIESEP